MTRLDVSGLSVSLAGAKVLDDVSFAVQPGEFVGLIGPNGAGKSTLLKAVLQLAPATGSVRIDGRNAAAMRAKERARLVSYLPQERDVAWAMTVEMLVSLGRAPRQPAFAPQGNADRAAVHAAMRRMDVSHLGNRAATELSGGELARVLIARALAQDTPLLLADEPAAGLDPLHQITLMRTFASLAGEGRAVIASLHDLGLAARWCTRIVLLHRGRILSDGAPEAVLSEPNIRTAYGVTILFHRVGNDWIVQPLDLADTNQGDHA